MISVEEALKLVLENERDFGSENVTLLQSVGRILAEDIFADRDFPPYDRVMMDGIAINTSAFSRGTRTFTIEKIQAAGDEQHILDNYENCIEVMTGATLPANTEVVIPYEQCEIKEGVATVNTVSVVPMQNVHARGTDSKAGTLLLSRLVKINASLIGIMASVGHSVVSVLKLPKITICSTGDELVDVAENPASHQVRRSNVYMLAAGLLSEGIEANTIHLADNPQQMTEEISRLLETNDVILFSGAVSKGKFDYLPSVLSQLGMQTVFHSVAQRPGKPFLFGKFSNNTLVFGFPGNPVSTFVCYNQFFRPWLQRSLKRQKQQQLASLATDFHFKPPLAYHLLVQITNNNGSLRATPVTGSTSGDLVSLTKVEGIICLPADRESFREGEVFELQPVF